MKVVLFNIASYIWLCLTGVICWVFFHILNKTTVVGKRNLSYKKNQLLIANHATMVDSWALAGAFAWWRAIMYPHLFPWHLPEEKNFMPNWWLRILCALWKCIPITRGTGDFLQKMPDIADRLRQGSVLIFPEGGRSRNPKSRRLCAWHNGPAVLAHRSQATIVPMAICGIEEVLPIGTKFPRFGRRIIVLIGKPLDLKQLYQLPEREALRQISGTMKKRLQILLKAANALYQKRS